MPTLTNQRHERFARLVVKGVPPVRAYVEAGYKRHKDNPYRLRDSEGVKARISQLSEEIAVKQRVTVETISVELDEAKELALRIDQPGAATQAIVAKAKLHGLLIDRKESGAPGEFAGMKTPAQIVAETREELGDEAAAIVAKSLGLEPEPVQAVSAEPAPQPGDVTWTTIQ